MKYYIKKEIPKRIETIVEKITCDLCGKEGKEGYWDDSVWQVNETDIKIKVYQRDGTEYPTGGDGTEYEVDMCPDCFVNKLIPWLESQGCKAKRKEWDW